MTETTAVASEFRLWRDFWRYAWRWVLFGVIAGFVFTPVAEGDFWLVKAGQAIDGIMLGAVCAILFTTAQNILNRKRIRWVSWVIALSAWMGAKFLLVGIAVLLGIPTPYYNPPAS